MQRTILNTLATLFNCSALAFTGSSAGAQTAIDVPPAILPGTCKSLDFNRATISSATKVDLAVQVDAAGTPVSVVSISEVGNSALLEAVVVWAKTCKFQPAMKDGQPTAATARLLSQFNPAPSAKPLGRGASIVDIASCAPKPEDYPPESRRMDETGTTRVSFTIDPEGRLTAFGVVRSSRYLRLDFTALIKLASCKFRPATAADGTPISASFDVDYVWKLE